MKKLILVLILSLVCFGAIYSDETKKISDDETKIVVEEDIYHESVEDGREAGYKLYSEEVFTNEMREILIEDRNIKHQIKIKNLNKKLSDIVHIKHNMGAKGEPCPVCDGVINLTDTIECGDEYTGIQRTCIHHPIGTDLKFKARYVDVYNCSDCGLRYTYSYYIEHWECRGSEL